MKVIHILPDNSVGGAPINVNRIIDLTKVHFNHEVLFLKYFRCDLNVLNEYIPIKLQASILINIVSIIFYLVMLIWRKEAFILCTHGRFCGLFFRILASIFSIPVVHTYRGFMLKRYTGLFADFKNNTINYLERKLSQTGTIIAVGASEYKAISLHLQPRKLELIYNPVSLILEEKNNNPEFDIIFIGRKSLQKGYDKFQKLVTLNKVSHIGWFGDDEDFEAFTSINDKVIIKPSVSDVSGLLKKTKLLGVLSRWEGASTVTIEALMSSVPVIALSCQGVDEFIDQTGGGKIVEFDDFLPVVEDLISNPSKMMDLKMNTAGIYEMVNLNDIKDKYINIYKSEFKNV